MKIRSSLITAVLITLATVSYSQTVASANSFEDFSAYNTIAVTQLTYQVVNAETNATLTTVNYTATQEKLTIGAEESIQFISLTKDGEDFLMKMPVFSNNLNLSMRNYDSGDYKLFLNVEGKAAPTVIEITKE